ncbi:MAG TPA: hypothetical protein VGE08_01280 [Steroidobacter sp.]|uniref:hypothetical protein n=1 Tax=Steroidobacter sp. TaxID=1978227 RepID=UPI002ED8706A
MMPRSESQSPKLHRVPVVWLAAAILLATIGGCVITIVLAQRYPDDALSTGGSLLHIEP